MAAGSAIRLTISSSLVVLLGLLVLASAIAEVRAEHAPVSALPPRSWIPTGPVPSGLQYVKQLWFGKPELWQASGVPSSTTVIYFDIEGSTQPQLEHSLDSSNICERYGGCAPDPAAPAGSIAWALEEDGGLGPSILYCDSPRTATYVRWLGHQVILPRWNAPTGSVTIQLVERWNALMAVLLTHELGHVAVAESWLDSQNRLAHQEPTCSAFFAFWDDPHLADSLNAAQNVYHARLRADCRPEIGCLPAYWMGW